MIRDSKIYIEMPESGPQIVSCAATFQNSDSTLAFYDELVALIRKHRAPPPEVAAAS